MNRERGDGVVALSTMTAFSSILASSNICPFYYAELAWSGSLPVLSFRHTERRFVFVGRSG
jgi:hypothetical protein